MFYFGHEHRIIINSQLLITIKNKEAIGCRLIVRPILKGFKNSEYIFLLGSFSDTSREKLGEKSWSEKYFYPAVAGIPRLVLVHTAWEEPN